MLYNISVNSGGNEMDSFELMLSIMFIAILFAVSPQGRDILRGLNSSTRIVKCSTNANVNVRITNDYNGVEYKPISVLQIQGDEIAIDVETIERPHRQSTFPSVLLSQLKVDKLEALTSGRIHFRLTRREFMNPDIGIDDNTVIDSFTVDELRLMSDRAFESKTALEGKIMNLNANSQEEIDDAIDRASRLKDD